MNKHAGVVPLKTSGCLLRVNSFLSSLNEAQRKVGQFILDNPEKVLNMTISEVALASEVSETTVFRFCRAIDYRGFQDFRISLARDLVEPQQDYTDNVRKSDDARTLSHKVFHRTMEILQDTLKVLDYNELERAYQALKNARKVLCMGLAMSSMTAEFAAAKLGHFGIQTEAITGTHFQAMRAAQLTKKDVMLGFSRSGNARDIIEATLVAKERGATCIGVTNKTRSYFARIVDINISVRSLDTRFRDDVLASRIEHFAVVDVFYTMLAARQPQKAVRNQKLLWDAVLSKQF